MKKPVKAIIGLSAALAALGGGLAVLMLTDTNEPEPENSDESSGNEGASIILIHDDKVTGTDPETGMSLEGVVKTVDVKNATDELHIVQAASSDGDTAVTYTIDGYQDIPQETSIVGTLANNANGLYSEDVIEENCTDPAKFGLASPEITVEVTYETGTKYTLLLGNETPTGSATYAMIKGRDTVYTVRNSAVLNYSKTLYDFIDHTILAAPETTTIVEDIRIERKDMDKDIFLEYLEQDDSVFSGGTSASHIMREPTEAYLSFEKSGDVTTGMFGLYAKDIFCLHCEDSDIAEAGLLDPFCIVTMNCDDGNSYKLLLSEPFTDDENGKCCYGMLEGGNVIYTIKTDDAKWVTIQPVDIAASIFIASYVWSVPELSVSADGKDFNLTIEQSDPSAELDSPKSGDFVVKLNGKTVDSEHYRLFYSFLLSAKAESFAIDEEIPSEKPLASINYTDSYNNKKIAIDFYDYSSMKALIVINGESKFLIAKSYVDTLKENAERIDSDENFVTTWK